MTCFDNKPFTKIRADLVKNLDSLAKPGDFFNECNAYVAAVKNNVDLSTIYTINDIEGGFIIAHQTIACVWNEELADKYDIKSFCDSAVYDSAPIDTKIIGQLEKNAYETVASDKEEI